MRASQATWSSRSTCAGDVERGPVEQVLEVVLAPEAAHLAVDGVLVGELRVVALDRRGGQGVQVDLGAVDAPTATAPRWAAPCRMEGRRGAGAAARRTCEQHRTPRRAAV